MKSFTSFAYKTLTALMVVMLALTAMPVSPAFADTSGPNFPLAGADVAGVGTITWANPGNVVTNNNTYATATTNGTTHYLQATNYGFAIPPTAIITGITVSIGRFGTTAIGNDVRDNVVRLLRLVLLPEIITLLPEQTAQCRGDSQLRRNRRYVGNHLDACGYQRRQLWCGSSRKYK